MKIPAPVCPARRAREGAPAAPFWSVDEAGPDERSLRTKNYPPATGKSRQKQGPL
jgi:hypothetical protein